jgi:hypothetical protein
MQCSDPAAGVADRRVGCSAGVACICMSDDPTYIMACYTTFNVLQGAMHRPNATEPRFFLFFKHF